MHKMPVPKVYQKSTEGSVVSYNYTDIAEGTGIVIFYGYVTENGAGLDYHLGTDSTTYSSKLETESASVTALDFDFDLSSFNFSKIVKGTGLLSFTIGSQSGTGTTTNTTCVATLRKWDGTTETDIATATSPVVSAGASTKVLELVTMPITIPKTHFKKGDTLRLNMLVTPVKAVGTQSATAILGHDPRNRDGSLIVPSTDTPDTITKIIFKLPFDLDL